MACNIYAYASAKYLNTILCKFCIKFYISIKCIINYKSVFYTKISLNRRRFLKISYLTLVLVISSKGRKLHIAFTFSY